MIIKFDDLNIIDESKLIVGKEIKIEVKFVDGMATIPRAYIKSINLETKEIEIEPLVELTSN